MKKILLLILTVILVLSLAACGGSSSSVTDENSPVENSQAVETTEETSSDVDWKQFLTEYEQWVDKYIEITNKYKANPSDLTILADYGEMATELTEWTSKTEDMQAELEKASPSELAEYSAELARIAAKIAKIAY